ncbi:MAG TPA: DUF1385 domain-containing protein [Clostridiaceae bacterium]|nr:DUF1385 domain-containing protein [Clostridiaceae bacterium]
MNTSNSLPPEVRQTTIGGQALIEGLMMIGPEITAMTVRLPDGTLHREEQLSKKYGKLGEIPLLRGSVKLIGQLVVGMKAMLRSAELSEPDAEKSAASETPNNKEASIETKGAEEEKTEVVSVVDGKDQAEPAIGGAVIAFVLVLSLLLGIGLFIFLPNLLTTGLMKLTGMTRDHYGSALVLNLIEGLVRIIILIVYIWLTSRSKEIARTWQYHGAEHKTIACYEHDMPLTVENVRRFSRFHPRCGTSFLFLVVFISALVFAVFGWHHPVINLVIRLLMIPVVAGLAYELQRFASKHLDHPIGRVIAAPGLWLQRLTTKEPDDEILEVSIDAMIAVCNDCK